MEFKEWLTICEVGETDIETKRGSDLFQDKAMEIAMYISYRHAYDSVAKSHRDAEISRNVDTGMDQEQSEKSSKLPKTAWSYRDWTFPSSGGTRSPKWIFAGQFPEESELQIIRDRMESDNTNVDEIAEELLTSRTFMKTCGGISYRDDKPGMIKLTGMWGKNNIAKMRAAVEVLHLANTKGLEIFTGADSALRAMIDKSERQLSKFHKRGLVPTNTLGIETPPKEVIPLLYSFLIKNPAASSGGEWMGYNADTGALKINLAGTGKAEKFIYGNKHMWKNSINKALEKSGVDVKMLKWAKTALKMPGIGNVAAKKINGMLKKALPTAPDVPRSGLLWLVNQATG